MAGFSLPFPPLAGNAPGASGADSSAFGNFYSNISGMGNPLTEAQKPQNPYDPRNENEFLPWAYTESRNREDAYNDPNRLRELMNVYKEFRAEEAEKANKMALQRQVLSTISQTGKSVSDAIALATYNPERQRILANIPNQMIAAYGAIPISGTSSRNYFM